MKRKSKYNGKLRAARFQAQHVLASTWEQIVARQIQKRAARRFDPTGLTHPQTVKMTRTTRSRLGKTKVEEYTVLTPHGSKVRNTRRRARAIAHESRRRNFQHV